MSSQNPLEPEMHLPSSDRELAPNDTNDDAQKLMSGRGDTERDAERPSTSIAITEGLHELEQDARTHSSAVSRDGNISELTAIEEIAERAPLSRATTEVGSSLSTASTLIVDDVPELDPHEEGEETSAEADLDATDAEASITLDAQQRHLRNQLTLGWYKTPEQVEQAMRYFEARRQAQDGTLRPNDLKLAKDLGVEMLLGNYAVQSAEPQVRIHTSDSEAYTHEWLNRQLIY